jgi:hypothetical protein
LLHRPRRSKVTKVTLPTLIVIHYLLVPIPGWPIGQPPIWSDTILIIVIVWILLTTYCLRGGKTVMMDLCRYPWIMWRRWGCRDAAGA